MTATTEYQGEMVDYSRHAVLLAVVEWRSYALFVPTAAVLLPRIAHCLTGWRGNHPGSAIMAQ
ncbi:hypothetical protein ACVXG8_20855 [Escherichia coli]